TTEMTMNIEVMGQTQTSTQNLSYHFTVDEKDVSATVNGQSFENVIKMTLVDQSGQMMTHFWMAKDVGPIFLEFIELNNADDASDDEWARREIVSYDLN
ncbi:MAG TPA: hypothetical protein VFM70_10610, partial [Salinimicrobium sp.]|nr:hypothetical protein [Salinimicrobium sp.]